MLEIILMMYTINQMLTCNNGKTANNPNIVKNNLPSDLVMMTLLIGRHRLWLKSNLRLNNILKVRKMDRKEKFRRTIESRHKEVQDSRPIDNHKITEKCIPIIGLIQREETLLRISSLGKRRVGIQDNPPTKTTKIEEEKDNSRTKAKQDNQIIKNNKSMMPKV